MAFSDDKKSPIERMRRSLYERKNKRADIDPRHIVHEQTNNSVDEDWQDNKAGFEETEIKLPPPRKTYKVLFWFSLSLFVVALAIALYSFFGGSLFVSSNDVDMTITGPASVSGGEPNDFMVNVQNTNKTDIELVDIIAEFPAGAKDPSNPTVDAGQELVSVGTIKAGASAQESFHAIFFGAEGDTETIKFTVEYHTADSNAVFYKEKDAQVSISSSPISVSISGLQSVDAGEPTTLTFTISSNSTNIIQNLALNLTYPFGWTSLSADPQASSGDGLWDLGDLAPGSTTTVTVSGKIDGQDGDQETVRAYVGIANQEGAVGTPMVSAEQTITIEKPFLTTTLTLDGDSSENHAAPTGKIINATLDWQNTGTSRISDANITVAFSGSVFDPSSVKTSDGYYDSENNTITWDGGRVPDLSLIAPGASGEFHFSFASLPSISNMQNAEIDLDTAITGSRIDESNVPQAISSESTRTVKIVSNLSLSSILLHSNTRFVNTGPLPPQVNQSTEYSVVWTAANTSNALSNVLVSATLPPYVTFTGLSSPSDGSLSYSSSTGALLWNVGAMDANSTKEMDFQISLTPNATQTGSSPTLMSGTTITGTDDFADVRITGTAPDLDTRATSDPSFAPGDEIVGQ